MYNSEIFSAMVLGRGVGCTWESWCEIQLQSLKYHIISLSVGMARSFSKFSFASVGVIMPSCLRLCPCRQSHLHFNSQPKKQRCCLPWNRNEWEPWVVIPAIFSPLDAFLSWSLIPLPANARHVVDIIPKLSFTWIYMIFYLSSAIDIFPSTPVLPSFYLVGRSFSMATAKWQGQLKFKIVFNYISLFFTILWDNFHFLFNFFCSLFYIYLPKELFWLHFSFLVNSINILEEGGTRRKKRKYYYATFEVYRRESIRREIKRINFK